MLKTRIGDAVWLVTQPDHAQVAGYLAAHWGGVHDFAQPGAFAPADHPELLRQEVVQAIAEHDNGWWEWEAAPPIDPGDGLPLGLTDASRYTHDDGLNRWRLGVPRLAEVHPYVALLISYHAHWLYAFAFDTPAHDDVFRHPLFGSPDVAPRLAPDREKTHAFLSEQATLRRDFASRLEVDPTWAVAVTPAHLYPHVRLLQVLDAMSLLLAFGGNQEHPLPNVPRRGWRDRVTLTWRPVAERRIVCDPYPFDADPLEVFLPVRVVPTGANGDLPLTRLHGTPRWTIRFELESVR